MRIHVVVLARIARMADTLHQTVVAVGEFVGESDLFVPGLVGESAAVAVEVGIDELARKRVAAVLHVHEIGVEDMRGIERSVIGTRPDHLLRSHVLAGKEPAVLRSDVRRVGNQGVLPLAHQRFARFDAGTQVFFGFVRSPGLPCRGVGRVVFAESAFVEAATRLESQRHIAGDTHRVDFQFGIGNTVPAGEIEVFEHFGHHVFTRITGLIKRRMVARIDILVVPGHGAEGLDFVHVKIGPPEACDALVMVQDRLAGRSPAEIAEEIVDITQVFPVARRPTGLVVGVEIVGQVLPLAAPSHVIGMGVARGDRNGGRDHGLQEPVGVGLQVALVTEIGRGIDLIGIPVGQESLAGAEPRGGQQDQEYIFHRLHGLRVRT